MTPTQLRAYSAVVRHGSVKAAAAEIGVTEAAISLHVAQLRKELEDQLFSRTAAGLAFTPGGLRLASRATEMLGLADRTVREVSQAGRGRRLMRVAASSLFAEHAAPGLIALFVGRAQDFDVELSVCVPSQFEGMLASRTVDVAIGPPAVTTSTLICRPFLNYEVLVVVAPGHPLAMTTGEASANGSAIAAQKVLRGMLREQTWLLGPSAAGMDGVVPRMLRHLDVPEAHQRIFQSHAAALEETRRGSGVALALSFAVAGDLAQGRLVAISGHGLPGKGVWSTTTLPEHSVMPVAAELTRFITTPRATQAMLKGSGVNIGHFRPSVHVTLWK